MKLGEALRLISIQPADPALVYPVTLACGFTPLHLTSYLAAHLQKRIPGRTVRVATGLYDDVLGTLSSLESSEPQAAVLTLEWADLDARLGFRSLGGWGQKAIPSIIESAAAKLNLFRGSLQRLSSSCRLVLSAPTLPLPPPFHTSPSQASEAELTLRAMIADFARDLSSHPSIRILNERSLDIASPIQQRYDLRSDLHSGFPYSLGHADTLGQMLAELLSPNTPKKGLISDLDDTLWLGLVGEVGAESVFWDLEHHGQLHGLYQQMLQALADNGALIAIASKNSLEVAEKALQRPDLAVRRESLYPLEVHWEPKSISVSRILRAWNIAADSVIFVDDNPLELEEVRLRHPDIECILFPKVDHKAFGEFLDRLRTAFGKPQLSEEDTYRLTSIRNSQIFINGGSSVANPDDLLASIQAEVAFTFGPPPSDSRPLELINKTNQFNLNGLRINEADWSALLNDPEAFVVVTQYKDKFGPLGKIAVVQGHKRPGELEVNAWVMSCRAFARRIEHLTIQTLFEKFDVASIRFDYRWTDKNQPVADFLSAYAEHGLNDPVIIYRSKFSVTSPKLYHKVTYHS